MLSVRRRPDERRFEVGDEILGGLESHGESDQVPRRGEGRVGCRRVRHPGGMLDQALDAAERLRQLEDLRPGDERDRLLLRLDEERDHPAEVAHLLGGDRVARMGRETRVENLLHAPVPGQPGTPGTPGAAGDPNAAGPMPLRRLTRREFNNTIRDLLGDTSNPADAFPVDRDQFDRRAVEVALAILDRGHLLAMWPEGTRDANELIPFYPGAAWIAPLVEIIGVDQPRTIVVWILTNRG